MNPLCVAVFAHNEEANICRCLDSLRRGTARPERLSVQVLINGCRDRTEAVVRAYAADHPEFRAVVIPTPGKANAWNTYLRSGIPTDADHIFVDGDIWVPAGALDAMEEALAVPGRNGVAPLPIGVSEWLREFLRSRHLIYGGLYGVKGAFLRRMLDAGLFLPLGLIGDDSILSTLLLADLDPYLASCDPERVAVLEFTGPVIPRPPLTSPETVRFYFSKLKRYAVRHYQDYFLYHHIRRHGLRAMPAHVEELYVYWNQVGWRPYLRNRGHQTPFNLYGAWKVIAGNARRWLRGPKGSGVLST